MPSKKLRKELTKTIANSPDWWWVRPFYQNGLFAPGYYVTYTYVGIMPDLQKCSVEIKAAILEWVKSLSDKEFDNHPSVELQVGPMKVFFYIGGPGSEPCCK